MTHADYVLDELMGGWRNSRNAAVIRRSCPSVRLQESKLRSRIFPVLILVGAVVGATDAVASLVRIGGKNMALTGVQISASELSTSIAPRLKSGDAINVASEGMRRVNARQRFEPSFGEAYLLMGSAVTFLICPTPLNPDHVYYMVILPEVAGASGPVAFVDGNTGEFVWPPARCWQDKE